MIVRPIAEPILDAEERFEGFENLMPFRVQDILLVSSLYDSFILREDGRLNELLIDESLELNLQQIPGITHVSTCAEALELANAQSAIQPHRHQPRTSGHGRGATGPRSPAQAGLDVPVVVLGYDYREIKNFVARNPVTEIDRVFLWQGNARILIAIVKYIEDKRNVLHDTRAMGVPVMLVVEDDIRYYSSFLPVIYTEMIEQSRRVIRRASTSRTSWCGCRRGRRYCWRRISRTRRNWCRNTATIFSAWSPMWNFRGRQTQPGGRL